MMMPPVVAKPTLYKALYQMNFLSAAGTACMFATLLSALLLRHVSRGLWASSALGMPSALFAHFDRHRGARPWPLS